MKPETAQKAAKWWADQLRTVEMPDNGEQSLAGMQTTLIASRLQEIEKRKQTPALIDAWEVALADAIGKIENRHTVYIGVDYHPDTLLDESAISVGLDLGMTTLPWKTNMWIEGDRVRVAKGYRAEVVDLP